MAVSKFAPTKTRRADVRMAGRTRATARIVFVKISRLWLRALNKAENVEETLMNSRMVIFLLNRLFRITATRILSAPRARHPASPCRLGLATTSLDWRREYSRAERRLSACRSASKFPDCWPASDGSFVGAASLDC
jgi:hypothetical protein